MKKMYKSLVLVFMVLFFSFSLSGFLSYMPAHPRTGETVNFMLKPQDVLFSTITWNFGDGSPAQTTAKPNYAITHVYAAPGTYMAVAEYGGVADSTLVTVTDPRRISFTPPGPKAGESVIFTAENFYSACIRWDFGDGTFKNGTPGETHSYANAGTYPVRAFEECGATYGASVTVKVVQAEVTPPPPPGPKPKPSLAISFVSLHFADGKADVSVPKGSATLMAYADLQVEGSGILQWQWLVDDVVVKSDTLAVTFGNKFTIDSGKIPGLPTTVPGNHRVMLRFLQPNIPFKIPIINYSVTAQTKPEPQPWTTPFGINKGIGVSPVAKKGLKISGEMCFYKNMFHVNIRVTRFNPVSNDYKPVSGAIVKVNGMEIPEHSSGHYYFDGYNYPAFPVVQPIKVSVSVDGKTYVGASGPFSRAEFVYPKDGDQVDIGPTGLLDAKWKWTGAPGPVFVSICQVVNNQIKALGSFPNVTSDHAAFPCSGWPADADLVASLRHDFADIVFSATGELQENCTISFWEYDFSGFHAKAKTKQLPPAPLPYPPKPSTESPDYMSWFIDQVKKTPRIDGLIDCTPWGLGIPGGACMTAGLIITLGGKPVYGADVRVNGVKLVEISSPDYCLYYKDNMYIDFEPDEGGITVTVTVNGITYNGVGTFDNYVLFSKPQNNSTVHLQSQPQIDFQWTFSNGMIDQVWLSIFSGVSPNANDFIYKSGGIIADHLSVPTASIPGDKGSCCVYLAKGFKDIVFDGFIPFTSRVVFCQGLSPQLKLYLKND